MRKYQVIALDLDGTLLTSDKTVSPRTLSALAKCMESGMQPVIVTGRARSSVPALLPPEFPVIPWICCHGAEVYLDGRRMAENLINVPLAQEIVRTAETFAPDMRLSTVMDGIWYANMPINIPHEIAELRSAIDRPIPKFVCDLSQLADAGAFQSSLPAGCKLILTGTLGEIVSAGVSKVSALRTLLAEWGLILHDAVAFGDHLPDLEMIASCGYGVAMGNAVPEVKEAADFTTTTNDEDGVAEVLERLL